ncbi:30 kDa heat shock [Pyrenophora seminiperda CCB06]|uniref:30 kDa heat shock n=1 Tax=Pyrenophora seminiperda CCB06 TaxID=1302712 RepID=A0A3M7LV69_9PLEO|nr:30 kDa heat shock [Pyrenophora seminiperda CCB06]
MAFILSPRFAPAYQAPQCNPFGFCAPVSRSPSTYRISRPQPRRSQFIISQVDELLNEIDREAQRQAQLEAQREAELAARLEAQRELQHQLEIQRQLEIQCQQELQRKRALRAEFGVSQNEKGWLINGRIHGFDQENINVEMIDERTLKVSGNTQWQSEKAQPEPQQAQIEAAPATEETSNEHAVENATESENTTAGAATPDSDTASHRSYQPTVEDDFEDLGDDATSSVASSVVGESKGKEKAVDEPTSTETAVVTQPQPEIAAQQPQKHQQEEKRVHGSFERTFRFPERIDVDNVGASFKDGVLAITVPKAQGLQARRIAIL